MRAYRDLRAQDRHSGRDVMKSRSVGMSACPDYERSDGLGQGTWFGAVTSILRNFSGRRSPVSRNGTLPGNGAIQIR